MPAKAIITMPLSMHRIGHQQSAGLDYTSDAVGIDIYGGESIRYAAAEEGFNLIWHTRGRKAQVKEQGPMCAFTMIVVFKI